MNNDLISRSALLAALVEGGIFPAMVRRTIENAPAVDAAPVQWIPVTERMPDTLAAGGRSGFAERRHP